MKEIFGFREKKFGKYVTLRFREGKTKVSMYLDIYEYGRRKRDFMGGLSLHGIPEFDEINYETAIKTGQQKEDSLAYAYGDGKKPRIYYFSGQKTYIIVDQANGLYKIGKSADPKQRLKQIRTSNPKAILYATCCNDVEYQLHREYAKERECLEWFNLTEGQVEHIIRTYGFTKLCNNTK